MASILEYRLKVQVASGLVLQSQVDVMRDTIARFRDREIDFAAVRAEMLAAFPGDRINSIIAML